MSRPDLLALSPESLAALANPGLVKRALREIAAGEGPELEEDEAGVVTGRFKDGVVAKLIPGLALRDTPCSCGAITACRHRVAVALAYPAWAASSTAKAETWSPGAITDLDLAALLGKRVVARARALADRGLLVDVRRGEGGAGERVPVARLPTCAVRFLVPRDLAYARCDCAAKAPCEHIAIAIWAFRKADADDPGAAQRTVELREGEGSHVDLGALTGALEVATSLLLTGVAGASVEHAGRRLARARSELVRAGLVWPAEILADLDACVRAYHGRSARYSSATLASLITELAARARAASRPGQLPARLVLGADEDRETELDHVRLVSIGARVDADGASRTADVYLADAGSGVVLLAARRWDFAANEEPEDGPLLAKRRFLGRVSLGALASGQLVSRDVVRLANGSLRFRRGGAQSSATPQTGAFEALPSALCVSDLDALAEAESALPPRFLRPRLLTDAMRVIAVGSVSDVVYRPGEQEISALIKGADGGEIELVRSHRRAAPHALDAIAEALSSPEKLRFVSGLVRSGRGGSDLEIDPLMLITDRVVVPDLAPEPARAPAVPTEGPREPRSALDDAMERAASCLEEACHLGLRRAALFPAAGAGAGWPSRAESAASALEEAGLLSVADRLRRVIATAREAIRGSDALAESRAVDAWIAASIRLALADASSR